MFSYFAKASLFTQLQFIFARWGVSGGSRASTCAREREREGRKIERGSGDSWKLTAATRENCAAAQEKQLTMLQVAVAAAPTPPPPLLLLLAASSCHCSWLWFSDCIAQDFNATVFARRVSCWLGMRLTSLHMLAAAHACKHKTQTQSEQQSEQHRQLQLQLQLLRCCQLRPFPVSNTSEASVAVFAGSLLRLAGITFSCLGFVSILPPRFLSLSLSLCLPAYILAAATPTPLLCKCISMLLLSLSLKSINISYWKVKWRIFVFLRENNSLFFLLLLLPVSLFLLFFMPQWGRVCVCVCALHIECANKKYKFVHKICSILLPYMKSTAIWKDNA